jgi:hypothetical protein
MNKLSRLWDWLLPALICLCPMGAMAYYNSADETETAHPDSERAGRLGLVSGSPMGAGIIRVARI